MNRSQNSLLWLVAVCSSPLLTSCVQTAEGVNYSQVPQSQLGSGEARAYFFRDKVLYLAQAPTVVTAEIQIDGRPIGGIKNGGFIEINVSAGRHIYSIGPASDQTAWVFDAPGESNVYFQVWDKTRMEGARAAGGLVVGAAAGGLEGANDGADNAESPDTLKANIRAGAVSGAISGGIQGAVTGFRGRVREGEGRFWAVDLVGQSEALPLLENLSLSDR